MTETKTSAEWSLWKFGKATLLLMADTLQGKPSVLTAFVETEVTGETLTAVSRSPAANEYVLEGEGAHPAEHAAVLENCLELYGIVPEDIGRIVRADVTGPAAMIARKT